MFTIVTFCTPEYEDCIEHFERKCHEFELPYSNIKLSSTGKWGQNTRLKPKALISAREHVRGPILYLDIDSLLVNKPVPPSQHKWDIGTIRNPRVEHKTKVSSQCMWINDTRPALDLLFMWDTIVFHSTAPDHPCLAKALSVAAARGDITLITVEETVKKCWKFNGQRPNRSQATLEGAL